MNPARDGIQSRLDGHVATLMLDRPPHNFLDVGLVTALADALDELDAEPRCRAVVLGSQGKSFCAGADLSDKPEPEQLYGQAMRLFRTRKPMVAAVHGAAIGAGTGLALVADFRIAGPAARFAVNFNRLGFHPGFGTSLTLPRVVGVQHAARLFYTGERIDGARALAIGLVDELVDDDTVLGRAQALAAEIAVSAPGAVQSTRETLRMGLAQQVAELNARELAVQRPQFESADFREGVAAAAARRPPVFADR
ncbi:enoyl-CoA hydratase/isomerase family protein [Variovorax sp. KK3]|uniref:enoyl-CoA hydratase/isomerase family protein n=1 Tax=Variovorax sp. KK3 TaxID=1855728 RepID=UPI00097C3526|nr:enoyl-CoA hydratase/isomerase family protein [Variovorax sp. KK3]